MNEHRIHIRAGAPALRERAEGGPPTLIGHAAVFDAETVLWDGAKYRIREVVRRGAFSRAVSEGQDVTGNMDHDDAILLGRTSSGTVRIAEDAVGLAVEIDLPDTAAGRDVAELVRRKDLRGMSFAFSVPTGGERTVTTTLADGRTDVYTEVLDVDLYDVSVVARPAYAATDVSARAVLASAHTDKAREAWIAPRARKLEALRARLSK